jgi:hypothetical protein
LLLEVKPTIDISAENIWAFRTACTQGNLEVAKWLLEVKPDINISIDHDWAFRGACEKGHIEVVKWLQSLCPEKYHIEIINNKIISYKVNNLNIEV